MCGDLVGQLDAGLAFAGGIRARFGMSHPRTVDPTGPYKRIIHSREKNLHYFEDDLQEITR
jgi:hypothetical protein